MMRIRMALEYEPVRREITEAPRSIKISGLLNSLIKAKNGEYFLLDDMVFAPYNCNLFEASLCESPVSPVSIVGLLYLVNDIIRHA